jgi:hypothetical protein
VSKPSVIAPVSRYVAGQLRIGVPRIPTALSYDTEVSWSASPEADVVGYEIVWRDTT